MNSIRFRIIRGQLRRWKTARNVHVVVVAAEHEVALPKEKVLDETVRLD